MTMKVFVVACLVAVAAGEAASVNPIQKVIEMISDLQAKVIGEGKDVQKIYTEFAEMCEDRSRELHFNIKTAKGEIQDLKATIADTSANIEELGSKIEELAGSIAESESELKKATKIRAKEHEEFVVVEKELVDTVDTIERATRIIAREMEKGGSFAQMKGVEGLTNALTVLVQASAINSADANRLTALVQSSSDDADAGAPAAAVYESKSGGIVDVLEGLQKEAEDQLEADRSEETKAQHNFDLLKQGLEDEIKFATKDMDKAKKALADNQEKKAGAEGDLEVTTKDLAAYEKSLTDLHHDCMTKATDFEDETKSRGEELEALATAKKIIIEATSGGDGAEKQTYGLAQVSFLQIDGSATQGALRVLQRLAFQRKSPALAQLAQRAESIVRVGIAQGSDPFAKVKELIVDMLAKLQKEGEADATKKAYCDKEMSETQAKQDDKTADIEKMTTKMDQQAAESAKLKEEVATLQKELAALTMEQAEMTKVRGEENEAYKTNKPEMEQGVAGIQKALGVLRDYYAKEDGDHDSQDGAASGIIGLLEVAESDFSKGLAEMIAQEESAAAAYDKETKENEISKATKEQDVKYKGQEAAALDKSAAELAEDRTTVQTELDAVMEYFKEIKEECVAKAPTYEEEKAARENEISGLKEALTILENDAALIQKKSSHRTLRGVQQHVQ